LKWRNDPHPTVKKPIAEKDMKVYNQSAFIPDFPVCISSISGNISLTLQDAKNLADQLNKIIKDIENK
jgi:hypothetical protein